MHAKPLLFTLLMAALPAAAAPCYVIYDRSDAVVYRDYTPPFDMSTDNPPERAMMRKQGQHLLVAEFDDCNPVGYISPTTGGTTASVEEIVNTVQPAVATSMSKGTVKAGIRPGSPPASRPGNAATNVKR